MGGGSATSAADQETNKQIQTGIKAGTAQQELNQVNQVTPTGSLTYTQTGKNKDGTPIFTATSKLNQPFQNILDTGTGAAQGILDANKAKWAAGPNINETGITNQIMDWGKSYYQPIFDAQDNTQEAKLLNQGIAPGSEAWNNAKNLSSRNQNDAYTQLLLQGQGTAIDAAMQNYSAPLGALSTLLTGAQPNLSFAQTPQASVQQPDYQAAYQNAQSQNNSMLGGLFSIPKTILGGWASGGLGGGASGGLF